MVAATHSLNWPANQKWDEVDETTFKQELQERLHMIENPDGPPLTVPDLPLLDVLIAMAVLALAIAGLMWWAY